MEQGDVKVILLILSIVVVYGIWRFNKWLKGPAIPRNFRLPEGAEVPQDEVVELLERAGFEVLAGKTKIPITMTLNEKETLESRLFVDYFVEKEEQLFVVKVARERKPLEMTGSSVRDMLLPYSLIYPEAQGILYVDMALNKIKKITFHIEV